MAKNIFTGKVISNVAHFTDKETGELKAGAATVLLYSINGEAIKDTNGNSARCAVKMPAGAKTLLDWEERGLGKGATVQLMADGWLPFDRERGYAIPAKGDLPSLPVHELAGLDPTSVKILKKGRPQTMVATVEVAAQPTTTLEHAF